LRVGKKAEFSVEEPIANSSMLVLPRRTAPAANSFLVIVASSMGTKFSSILELQVVRMPRVSTRSLRAIGRPSSGASSPAARRASAAFACPSATAGVTVTYACTSPLSSRSMRSR